MHQQVDEARGHGDEVGAGEGVRGVAARRVEEGAVQRRVVGQRVGEGGVGQAAQTQLREA